MSESISKCKECGVRLEHDEVEYLEGRCNSCETLAHERMVAWREGAHDPALDAGRFFIMPEVH